MSTSIETIDVQVPFAGFYNTCYSEMIDNEEASFIEWKTEELGLTDKQSCELAELMFHHTDYRKAYVAIAEDYVDEFNKLFEEWSGVNLQLSFVEMQSPREYNFMTDRVFAKADLTAICTLRGKVDEAKLVRQMEMNHKSRDGFISFYSHILENWPESVEDWDHNQLHTMIECFLPEDWDWKIYDQMSEYGNMSPWDNAVNWEPINEFLEQFEKGDDVE